MNPFITSLIFSSKPKITLSFLDFNSLNSESDFNLFSLVVLKKKFDLNFRLWNAWKFACIIYHANKYS